MQDSLVARKVSVCLSVKTVNCDKTKERSVQIFIPYKRLFSLVFWEEEWLVAQPLLSKIFGKPTTVESKSPILNWHSLTASQL